MKVHFGDNMWACPDLPTVNIFTFICSVAAVMRPVATSIVATCLYCCEGVEHSDERSGVEQEGGAGS